MVRRAAACCLVAALACCLGCATYADSLHDIRSAYDAGNLTLAADRIDVAMKNSSRDADVLKLERATVLLNQGRAKEAEKTFREVRDRFDELEGKNVGRGALAMLTDDQRLAYSGEDYEKVLVRAFLALSSLVGDGQDAAAYALQVGEKQRQIIDTGAAPDGVNRKQSYKQVAAGAYVHAALREETQVNYDDAARSLELVCAWAPEFTPGKVDLDRVKTGHHSQKGNGVVYVFTLVGRGPHKEEKMEVPTTVAMLVADRIITAAGKRSLTPTIAPIKVPRVVQTPNFVQAVRVVADGADRGLTATLTDVGRLAVEQADADFPTVLGRAVARRTLKKAILYAGKEALHMQKDSLANLAVDAAGVAWEATESADTRCWGLLPEKIQVIRLELPAGPHQLLLQPTDVNGVPQGPAEPATVEVGDGRNTYVLASFPTGRLAGHVVTSRAGH